MGIFRMDAGWRCRMNRQLGSSDYYALVHLYQPIVGASSVALYMTLSNLLPPHRSGVSPVYKHSHLLRMVSLSHEAWLEARHALEGVGLLNTWELRDREQGILYEYEVIPPLLPERFFQSDVLSLTLCRQVGKERFLQLREELVGTVGRKNAEDGTAVNVTRSFSEVFESLTPQELARSAELRRDELGMLEWEGDRFDQGKLPEWDDEDSLALVRMRLGGLVDEQTWTPELLRELKEIRFLYSLDDWDLIKALQNPYVTHGGRINMERLRSFVKNEYRLRFGGSPVVTVKRGSVKVQGDDQPAPARKDREEEGLTEEERHFRQLAEMSPLELLSHYHQGKRIPDSDVKLVESLMHQYGLPAGVINVLLEYVLLRYDYKLPRKLVEKIAGQWQRARVRTIEEALELARKESWDGQKKATQRGAKKTAGAARAGKLPASLKHRPEPEAEEAEEPPVKQAEIRAKLKLMNERFALRREREQLR
ncbi:DnaD domain protein [Staphylospora marina]|uniref:DnaD domain protein n=1 Tax=Staphylospora marina TaxID=2490858 RepID=UPI000F5BD848|nr:DnaD domain protein [Staphylospora marina]